MPGNPWNTFCYPNLKNPSIISVAWIRLSPILLLQKLCPGQHPWQVLTLMSLLPAFSWLVSLVHCIHVIFLKHGFDLGIFYSWPSQTPHSLQTKLFTLRPANVQLGPPSCPAVLRIIPSDHYLPQGTASFFPWMLFGGWPPSFSFSATPICNIQILPFPHNFPWFFEIEIIPFTCKSLQTELIPPPFFFFKEHSKTFYLGLCLLLDSELYEGNVYFWFFYEPYKDDFWVGREGSKCR